MHFQPSLVSGATAERVFALIDDPQQRRHTQSGLEETGYTCTPQGDSPLRTRFTARIREGGRLADFAAGWLMRRIVRGQPTRLKALSGTRTP